MFLSYDEGRTWPVKKSLCPTGSAYSSIAILEDVRIGVYAEENYNTDMYSTYFMNFSLDWLTNQADTYIEPGVVSRSSSRILGSCRILYRGSDLGDNYCHRRCFKSTIRLMVLLPRPTRRCMRTPITLSETVTVNAIAMKEGMSNSVMTSPSTPPDRMGTTHWNYS